ncbi:hypothetical protein [Winogradskyella luteola]|uniref:Kazal-like domain-containing protein n=1 Tax=Winogradskyella luteola TaxID=2828330 RepID=A0A9X1F716_9FLAO|nr:hypothetical protein [Winogradskyella luteola]MBV7267823.1 hypothetical protein [Winogradskyella luteola]
MKNLKFTFFSMFMALFLVTACTNNEPVGEEEQQTEESQSITASLNQLSTLFNDNGNIELSNNPAGNIVLDFCFDFVYPLTLSYNNGSTVTIQDLDNLVDVMLSSTDELYIDGISFPFDVETFNDDTDSIEIETIEDEEEFIDLLEDCDFDEDDDECYEEYDPVCVEVTSPNGETFIVTYPNECYAEWDGFGDDDFLDDCGSDYYVGGFECFSFNFPISVVTEDGEMITINSEEELSTELYDVYVFDFVYPFAVTVYEDEDDDEEDIVIINSAEDFEDVLEDCYDDYYDDDYEECEECEDEPVNPVCVEYTTAAGETIVTAFPNMCFAECEGFAEDDVVDCGNGNNPQTCTLEDIENNLVQCEWYFYTSLVPESEENEAEFTSDGVVVVYLENAPLTGTWELSNNALSNEVTMSFVFTEPLDTIANLDWTVIQCNEEYILLESGNEYLVLEGNCD